MYTAIDSSTTFYDQLKFALDHYDEPALLGEQSSLAQPYFLGRALTEQVEASTHFGRGSALCDELGKAAKALWKGPLPTDQATLLQTAFDAKEQRGFSDQYHYLLLDLSYFHDYFPTPRKQSEIYSDILHVSRATYDRHLREAIRRLGELLLLRLQPTLHSEQPTPAAELFGRNAIQEECLAILLAQKSVYLCGPSGMGKTALGAALAEQWTTPAVFWFTVRVTLNDQLTSLLFALGNFLHQHGSSRLWLQLIANAGVIKDANLALELARMDLAELAAPPLLCFDEIDLLRPADIERETVPHTQFLAFVEGLYGHAALLFIGQRTVLPGDLVHSLERLTRQDIGEWLTRAHIPVRPTTLGRLDEYTGGNPRLIALCLVLHQAVQAQHTTTLDDVLDQLPLTPALGPIWQRLQQRLDRSELALLQALSVFRSTAPRDAWHTERAPNDEPERSLTTATTIERLIAYRLVQEDKQGGIALLPTLREIIYTQLPVEAREDLHGLAGAIRALRGEYTAAAYHYSCAGRPDEAISLWYPHYDQEVRRGQAAAALAIFQQISAHRLSDTVAETLRLLRSRLLQLGGQSLAALTEVESVKTQWAVDAATVGGDALRTLGQADAALVRYGDGLAAAALASTKYVAPRQAQHVTPATA
ncbi:MAG: ATP-binding protein [Caldilineaceae bacterium]